MSNLWKRLWADDRGAILATEYVTMLSILGLGTISSLVALRNAVVSESVEVSNAIMALDQSYYIPGVSGAGASSAGSAVSDTPGKVSSEVAAPMKTSSIDCQSLCD
jgi:hypothetical protein